MPELNINDIILKQSNQAGQNANTNTDTRTNKEDNRTREKGLCFRNKSN